MYSLIHSLNQPIAHSASACTYSTLMRNTRLFLGEYCVERSGRTVLGRVPRVRFHFVLEICVDSRSRIRKQHGEGISANINDWSHGTFGKIHRRFFPPFRDSSDIPLCDRLRNPSNPGPEPVLDCLTFGFRLPRKVQIFYLGGLWRKLRASSKSAL